VFWCLFVYFVGYFLGLRVVHGTVYVLKVSFEGVFLWRTDLFFRDLLGGCFSVFLIYGFYFCGSSW